MATDLADIIQNKLITAQHYQAEGRFIQAIKLLKPLCIQDPDNALLFWILGHLYWRTGNLEEAAEHFRHSTVIEPDNPRARLGLFHTLRKAGKTEEAFAELEQIKLMSGAGEVLNVV